MIAALFVETDGCYSGVEDVEPWGKERDARLYAGPAGRIARQRFGVLVRATSLSR